MYLQCITRESCFMCDELRQYICTSLLTSQLRKYTMEERVLTQYTVGSTEHSLCQEMHHRIHILDKRTRVTVEYLRWPATSSICQPTILHLLKATHICLHLGKFPCSLFHFHECPQLGDEREKGNVSCTE